MFAKYVAISRPSKSPARQGVEMNTDRSHWFRKILGKRSTKRQRTRRRSWRRLRLEPLEARCLLAVFAVNSVADTIDANPGDGLARDASGQTTLRAAIMEANALSGADTINLPAGTYTLTLAGANEDGGATGDLDITSDINIQGAGRELTFVDGGQLDRVIHLVPNATAPYQTALSENLKLLCGEFQEQAEQGANF